VQHDKVILTAV